MMVCIQSPVHGTILIVIIVCAGQHNDSRMNIALIMTAVRHGAIVANHCEVTELQKASTGKLNGARLKDNLTGKEWDIRAKVCPVLF